MDFLKLAKKRYACRKYLSRQVEPEKLELILEAGRVAPTGANRQPQRLVVVQSKEGMERLARCTRDFGAPTAVIVCADTSEAWTRKYDGKNISDIDASIVTDHMMLAAASLGLDTLWICIQTRSRARGVRPSGERRTREHPADRLRRRPGGRSQPPRHAAQTALRDGLPREVLRQKRGSPVDPLFYPYFAYRRKVVRHDSPGSMARNPSAAGSAALGAFVVHVCGSGQQ